MLAWLLYRLHPDLMVSGPGAAIPELVCFLRDGHTGFNLLRNPSEGAFMLFGKLLPREGNFFEMFNQHAQRMV